jgi:hypothetical protein
MKKLRFFGLLAATVLLAFALVVACSNGSTEPPDGPGPVEPSGPPAYSIPPGGVGPGTTGIKGPDQPPATGIRLRNTVISIEVGESIRLLWDPIPADAYVDGITWESSSPSNVAVSNTGTVVGVAANGEPVNATITARAFVKDADGKDVQVGPDVQCDVIVYKADMLNSTTPANLALLGWDLLKKYSEGADTTKRDALASAASIRVKALSQSGIKDMATLASQSLLSTKVGTPVYNDKTDSSKPVLTYYPVLKGARYFELDFARTGWAFAEMNKAETAVERATGGNTIPVGDDGNMVERFICYPVDGVAVAKWAFIKVRVIPCTEVTFSVASSIKGNLNADKLLLTAAQESTILLNLVSKSNSGAEALTGFKLGGTDDTNPQDVGALKGTTTLTRTALIWANFPGTKIRLLTVVETSPSPKDYTLTAGWGALPASTQFNNTYSEYAVGGLPSDSYEISLTRAADIVIPSITIRGFLPYSKGDSLSTTPADISSPNVTTVGNLTWHGVAPTADTPSPPELASGYTAKAGEKIYAKIVLDPATGYVFSPNITLSCVANNSSTPPAEVSIATATSFPGTGDNAKRLTIVLEFTVQLAEISVVNFNLNRPNVGEAPMAVTSPSDEGVQSPATVNWTLTDGDWYQTNAKTGDVYTAEVTIRAIDGYQFATAFSTIVAADFAETGQKINFPGAAAGTLGTGSTATLSTDRKALTIKVVFAAVQ